LSPKPVMTSALTSFFFIVDPVGSISCNG